MEETTLMDFSKWFPPVFWKKVGLSALRAFLGAFAALAPGIWMAPDFNAAKAAGIAAVVAGLTAAFRAVQAVFTNLEPTAGRQDC